MILRRTKRTLRLITTYDCNRNCKGCCNKQIPFRETVVQPFDSRITPIWNFDEIILTGGEPLLHQYRLLALTNYIKIVAPDSKLILYTAKTDEIKLIMRLFKTLDGLTITVHTKEDIDNFMRLNFALLRIKRYLLDNNKSLRLNIFKEADFNTPNLSLWKIKRNIEWIEDCPLPINETIRKI